MASRGSEAAPRDIRRLFESGTVTGMSDAQLLERFASRKDEAAFEALLRRHGPMVLGVCRRVLGNPHDAQDAFQATFLVLARKAGTLRAGDSLGPWFHGVAHRVAIRARAGLVRWRSREKGEFLDPAGPAFDAARRDAWAVLHEEVNRLPEKYGAPIVLCYLEGLSHEQAAYQLGWPSGTVSVRLMRARGILRSRLTRRGLAPPAGLLAATLAAEAAPAVVPAALGDWTIKAAIGFAAGRAASTGAFPAAAILANGFLRTMLMTKLKMAAVALLVVGATGAGVIAQHDADPRPEASPVAEGPPRAINPGRTATAPPEPDAATQPPPTPAERTRGEFQVAEDRVDGPRGAWQELERLDRQATQIRSRLQVIEIEASELRTILHSTEAGIQRLRSLPEGLKFSPAPDTGIAVPPHTGPATRRSEGPSSPREEAIAPRPELRQIPLAFAYQYQDRKGAGESPSPSKRNDAPGQPGTPPPPGVGRPATLPPLYVVDPPDLILVEVLEALPGRPLTGERLVRPDGRISLGFYGEVHVAGLTTTEIKEKVVLHLRKFVSDEVLGLSTFDPKTNQPRPVEPRDSNRVFVDVTAYNSKVYYIQGDVKQPGRFHITGSDTVLDAIHYAGGLLPMADPQSIRLIRRVPGNPDATTVLPVDYIEITTGTDTSTNHRLMPGDRLVVYRDPKADGPPQATPPAPTRSVGDVPPTRTDASQTDRRLIEVERKLDRLLEALEGSKRGAKD